MDTILKTDIDKILRLAIDAIHDMPSNEIHEIFVGLYHEHVKSDMNIISVAKHLD